jgi:hypothetical protein
VRTLLGNRPRVPAGNWHSAEEPRCVLFAVHRMTLCWNVLETWRYRPYWISLLFYFPFLISCFLQVLILALFIACSFFHTNFHLSFLLYCLLSVFVSFLFSLFIFDAFSSLSFLVYSTIVFSISFYFYAM